MVTMLMVTNTMVSNTHGHAYHAVPCVGDDGGKAGSKRKGAGCVEASHSGPQCSTHRLGRRSDETAAERGVELLQMERDGISNQL